MDNKAKVTAGRQYLKITSGAKLVIGTNFDTPATTITNLNPHYFEDDKTPTLKSDWYWELSKTNLSKDSSGAEWYQLPIAKQPDKTFGWIKKGDSKLNIIGQYDLKELGFTPIKEDEATKTHGDVFVDAEQVKAGRNNNVLQHFFGDIIKEIDNLGAAAEKGDGKLSLSEIQKAYADQDGLGQTLQKIVGYYPTEWYNAIDIKSMMANRVKLKIYTSGTQAQKDRIEQIKADTEQILTEFITPENKYFIDQEQQRVNKLMFWDKVPELTSTPKVYHFHPVKFIEQLQVDSIVTYHVYANGDIEKHTPSSIADKFKNKYKYVYHDKNGGVHDVCTLDWHSTKKKSSSGIIQAAEKDHPTHATVESNTAVSDGDTKRRVIYTNGDVAEYGKHDSYPKAYVWRVFYAQADDSKLVKMPDTLDYDKNGIKIQYNFSNSVRRYANGGLFAAIIGSLAEYGKSVTTTGSAFYWGSCFPSTLHINGMSIDFTYKSRNGTAYLPHTSQEYKDDLAFLNAMRKFFSKIRVGSDAHFKDFRALSDVVDGGTLHSSHFHSDFSSNKVKEIEE